MSNFKVKRFRINMDKGANSMGKMFSFWEQGPEFGPQKSRKKSCRVWWHALAIPVLGKRGKGYLELAGIQPHLLDNFHGGERHSLQKIKSEWLLKRYARGCLLISPCAHVNGSAHTVHTRIWELIGTHLLCSLSFGAEHWFPPCFLSFILCYHAIVFHGYV